MHKQAVLLVNLRARRGRDWFETTKQALIKEGIELVTATAVRNPAFIPDAVSTAVRSKVPLIVVGGGDGTLSLAASQMANTESTLGILPLGTGNALARDLGIKVDVKAAADVLCKGKEARIDLGRINEDYFINITTLGLSTRIASQLTVQSKRRLGRLVYGIALCRALFHLHRFDVTIRTENHEENFRALQLVIGSGKYHAGPFPLSPTSSITDGKLDLYAILDCSIWSLFKYALYLPGGRFTELKEIAAEAITGGTIETRPVKLVAVDGEVRCSTPFRFGIAPQALKVMVPSEFQG